MVNGMVDRSTWIFVITGPHQQGALSGGFARVDGVTKMLFSQGMILFR